MEVGCGLELRPTPVLRVFRDLWRAGLKRAGGIWKCLPLRRPNLRAIRPYPV